MTILAIVFLIAALVGWGILAHRLITRQPHQFMPMKYRIILLLAGALSLLCFLHDWKYDKPVVPYTTADNIIELVIVGAFYTAVFFFILSGIYKGLLWFFRLVNYSGKA